jgi:hypothetical protein
MRESTAGTKGAPLLSITQRGRAALPPDIPGDTFPFFACSIGDGRYPISFDKEIEMKKTLSAMLIGVCILALSSLPAAAHHRSWDWSRNESPRQMVTASLFVFRPWSAGFRQRIVPNVYLTATMDYHKNEKDLRFQTGAIYRLSRKLLFFRLYGGGGMEFSRNDGYLYPYITVGADFWIFYSEVSHPLRREKDPTTRFGFRFSF